MGERISSRRDELRITLRELADKTGLTVSGICKIQNGRGINLRSAIALAEALHCSLDWLCGRSQQVEVR